MWAKVDDGFWCHPKVMGLSGSACGLWVRALSWSCAQRTEFVPVHFLGMVRATAEDAAELVAAGLWVESDGAWIIHDWAQYQELSTSEKRAEAGRRGGRRSGEARRSKPKQNDAATSGDGGGGVKPVEASDEAGTRPGPTRPVPSQKNAASIGSTTSVVGAVDEAEAWTAPQDLTPFVAEAQRVVELVAEARAALHPVPGIGTHADRSGPVGVVVDAAPVAAAGEAS